MDPIWLQRYDPGVPHQLDAQPWTLPEILDRAAERWPERPALTFRGRTLRYSELVEHVDRLAASLAELGVERDTKVSLWMPNIPQMVIAFFATWRLGAQAVCTNPLYVERELEHQLNDAGVRVVITCDFLWHHRLRPMLDRVPTVERVVVTSIGDYLPWPLRWLAPLKLRRRQQWARVRREPRVRFFRELIASAPAPPPWPDLPFDHLAALQYTGGTTGLSKGAMLTHQSLSLNAQQCLSWDPSVKPGEEVGLGALPYFHSFGMTVAMIMPILVGAHIVLMPDPRDVSSMVRAIPRYRVSAFPAVPAMYAAITSFPGIEALDLSSLRYCFCASAPLPLEVLERFEAMTGGCITEGYGMTEASPATHVNPIKGPRKPGTVGLPLPGTDMKIVDVENSERELAPGVVGEICVRGPQVMAGYWQRPGETTEMLRGGWLHTGDLGRVDDEGFTTIVGRKKEMIIAGGYNVYPDEIDQVLFAHPAVLEAATIGVPDPRLGESVKSFVVLRPDADATVDELIAHCRRELAAYKAPRQIELVDGLPRSSVLKILRRELLERELAKG